MNNIKRLLYWLSIFLLMIIVIICGLVYSEGVRMKGENDSAHLMLQIFWFSKIRNFCNNKTRLKGSECVLSYTVFGKSSW